MRPIVENRESVKTRQRRRRSQLGPEEVVLLLAKLPPESKKVLAMYYHENMRLLDIATCLGFTESDVCQIHEQSVASLHLEMVK
jgi:DNA-directed RNA polymerase specialized sigma subunit